jgi:hypothetical protein
VARGETFGPLLAGHTGAIIPCVGQPAAWLKVDAVRERFDGPVPTGTRPGQDREQSKILPFRDRSAQPPRPAPHAHGPGTNHGGAATPVAGVPRRMTAKGPRRQWHSASFAPVPLSVRAARQFVGSLLPDPVRRELGELLVSELTTNALRYGPGPFQVRVLTGARARVEVFDGGTTLPSLRDSSAGDESGRGLQIVSQLAAAWGTEERPDGKVVWFEL